MRNIKKGLRRYLIIGAAGIASLCFLVYFLFLISCALSFYVFPPYKVQALFSDYQRNINRISDNKLLSYKLDSGGDWDPYNCTIILKTKNNAEVFITLLNTCDGFFI
jgi:hypothetical protein